MKIVHLLLSASNILGLPALAKSSSVVGRCVTVFAMSASVWMHISETKHKLNPGNDALTRCSSIFLNIDRLAAIIAAIYFSHRWYIQGCDMVPVVVMCIGTVCSFIGEQTNNLNVYVPLHIVWHACAYYCMWWLN